MIHMQQMMSLVCAELQHGLVGESVNAILLKVSVNVIPQKSPRLAVGSFFFCCFSSLQLQGVLLRYCNIVFCVPVGRNELCGTFVAC
jgi:hypothetical protein